MSEHRMKSIWYFVGLLLLIMGGITFVAGIVQAVDPPPVKTVLAEIYPGIWWGAVMLVGGGLMFYYARKEPRS